MKEISTRQYSTIAGGYGEQCGGGPSTSNSSGCSSGGSKGPNGGRGNRFQEALYKTSNEGSGSGAYSYSKYKREVGSSR